MKESFDYLLIDVGNTSIKFASANRTRLGAWTREVSTQQFSFEFFTQIWQAHDWKHTILCSVVPRITELIRSLLPPDRLMIIHHLLPMGIRIDYPNPETIGADRLVNAAAAAHLGKGPAIVIDFGTALTFDILSHDHRYLGGVIAPGLGALRDYLHEKTALLPKIDLTEPDGAIGKSTKEAMRIGAIYGYRGLIKEILQQVRRTLQQGSEEETPVRIYATGGHAALISEGVPEIGEVHPTLTLEGLRIIGNLNASQSLLDCKPF